MNEQYQNEDADVELVPIPMDRATRERLVRLSDHVNEHPTDVAAELLAALLRDDEEAHSPNNRRH